MEASIDITFGDIDKKLARMERRAKDVLVGSARNAGQEILDASRVIVPVKTGLLRSSGTVEVVSRSSNVAEVEVSYGKTPDVPYALIVHERRGVRFRQRKRGSTKTEMRLSPEKQRQRKYLEIPFLLLRHKLLSNIEESMKLHVLTQD